MDRIFAHVWEGIGVTKRQGKRWAMNVIKNDGGDGLKQEGASIFHAEPGV